MAAGPSQAPSACWGWHQPLCIPTRGFRALGAKARLWLRSSLCFCSMRCKGPEGMRSGEAGDAPAFLPHARGRRGSWNCTQDDRSLAGATGGGRQGWPGAAHGSQESPRATAQFLLKPVGFCSCHRHRSSPATGRTAVRGGPGEGAAGGARRAGEGDALTHLVQAKISFPAQLTLGQRRVGVAGGHISLPSARDLVLDLQGKQHRGVWVLLGLSRGDSAEAWELRGWCPWLLQTQAQGLPWQ